MSLVTLCDVCGMPIEGRGHPTVYADNSCRRVDVCKSCVDGLRFQSQGDTGPERFIAAVMGFRK